MAGGSTDRRRRDDALSFVAARTREFCSACGTGLFYRNPETLPGIVDIQSGTLDDPEGLPPGAQIMVKERLGWAPGIADLPAFNAYPGMD